jgi:hypothetical protein
MAVLGHILKGLIDLKNLVAPAQPDNVPRAQAEQLTELLQTARDTAFGRHFDFAQMLDSGMAYAIYKNRVPIYDYHRLHAEWWARQQREPDITWPGRPPYFALSSGTTGKESKRIPVTEEMLASIQSVGRAQAESLANFDLPGDLFEKDVLMLSSSADLVERDGHYEGEISGINVSNIPDYFRSYYKPGFEIAQIDDWDERLAAIVRKAPEWDIVAIAGIPSWVQMMLRAIVQEHHLANIHELWPDLSIYTSGGVAFEPFRDSFEALLARPIHIMDTYLASEGFFAYNARPDTMAMQLAVDNGIFYEFVPFDASGFDESGGLLPHPRVLSIAEVEENKDYALLVSTPAGAWRYLVGDTIKFTDLERYEIVITGRTKYFLNVVGSQLSEEKLNAAVTSLAKESGSRIKEYGVAAVRNEAGEYIHQWVLGLDAGELDPDSAREYLDRELQAANKNYGVARSKALRGVRVRVVPADRLYDWLASTKKKGGQIKMPKVMPAEKMQDLLTYLDAAA